MRKIVFLLLVMILLQSCGPTNTTAEPTFTSLPTASPTIICLPTQDFYATPTIVKIVPIYVGSFTATFASNILTAPPGPGPGFDDVSVKPTKIFWGGCEQNKAVIA